MSSKPMRILQVVPNMNVGGLETLIMNLYRNIDRTKIQFDFLVHYKGEFFYSKEIEQLGGKICHLTVRDDHNILKYVSDLRKFFSDHPEYNIIHGHMVSTAIFYLYFAKKNGCELRIIHCHNTDTSKSIKGIMKKILAAFSPVYANKYIACGEMAGKTLFGKRKFDVIKNGIETERFKYNETVRNEMRRKLEIEDFFVIGHVGRFTMQKNHEFLLKVFERIHAKEKNSVLLLIGEGELLNKVSSQAHDLGIVDSVKYLGVRNDVEKLYQAMDVFILPSFFEGFPVVATECQAAGLPMLVSNRVSREVGITSLVKFLGLEESADIWADIALQLAKRKRRDFSHEVCAAGYDIKQEAKKLAKLYMSK